MLDAVTAPPGRREAAFVGCCLVLVVLLCVAPLSARRPASPDSTLPDDTARAIARLQSYLRLDTTNPPGNEMRAVEFFAQIFEQHGIEYELAETAPGRGNIWARLEGGPGKALVLLHHTDVVPANPEFWDFPPFSGALTEGHVYGRGALDTKSLGILHLEAFLRLAQSGRELVRPVVFMATADEEAGGHSGAGWMVERRPELFEDVGFLLNEGGGGMFWGDVPVFSVEVTQKVPLWLRLRAEGAPGHGSTPRAHGAVGTLLRALTRLERHRFAPRVVEPVRRYLAGLADLQPGMVDAFTNLDVAVRDPRFMRSLHIQSPPLHALLRNTCAITVLEASSKINVVPPVATAEVDCRLLPGVSTAVFLAELRQVIAEPSVTIDKLMSFAPAVSTPDSELFRVIERVSLHHYPDARVLPSVVSGFTDSHYFRDLGIISYGFRPSMTGSDQATGVHGNNERIEIGDFEKGLQMMREIVEAMALPGS